MSTGESSSVDTESASVTAPHFPDELKLQILRNVFDFPQRGRPLRASSFFVYKRRQVDPILTLPCWCHLVPEALYANKTFALELLIGGQGKSMNEEIHYPPPHCATYIRTMEIYFNHVETFDGTSSVPKLLLKFLRKLEADGLGFDKLDLLRFVFKMRPLGNWSSNNRCEEAVNHFSRIAPFHFRAKKFEVQMEGHVCGEHCPSGVGPLVPRLCQLNNRIKQQIRVSPAEEDTEE